MRLISYHIENFGKIKNTSGDFSREITEIYGENGYGKTTLASFVKAMFYGFTTAKKNEKSFNERERYLPFDGGRYGGNIRFEWNGKIYRIERFFDGKSETKDEFSAYCGTDETHIFDELGVGQTVFGLDKESFAKTVFLTADDIDVQTTESISERLSNLLGKTDDRSVDFKGACDKLEKLEKKYKKSAKNGVHTDKIGETNAKIESLNTQIRNLRAKDESLKEKYIRRKELLDEREQVRKLEGKALELSRWKTYDDRILEATKEEATAQALLEKYPLGFPTDEEMKTLKIATSEQKRKITQRDSTGFGEEKRAKLQALQARFERGVPTEDELARAQNHIDEIRKLSLQIENIEGKADSEYESLKTRFGEGKPTQTEISEMEKLVDEYTTRENEMKNLRSMPTQGKAQNKGGRYALILLALACIGGGIGLFAVQVAIATALIAVGAVLGVSYFLAPKNAQGTSVDNASVVKLQAENDTCEGKINAFLARFGYYSENGVRFGMARLLEDKKQYEQLKAQREESARELARLKAERKKLQSETESFLRAYGDSRLDDLQTALVQLRTAIENYKALRDDEANARKTREEADGEIDRLTEVIVGIYNRYQIDCAEDFEIAYERLAEDKRAFEESKKRSEQYKVSAEKYKAENGLQTRPQGEESETEQATARREELDGEIARLDTEIDDLEYELDGLGGLESELATAQEDLKEYKRKYKIIKATREGLERADKNLRERYVEPIKKRFVKYAETIERTLGENIEIKEDFTVEFDRSGKLRKDKHLSAGEKTACALCMRLALVDNLFESEQPFIVMDDPFVHLDEGHFACVASVVRELSKDRQIVYFTCHESRKICKG